MAQRLVALLGLLLLLLAAAPPAEAAAAIAYSPAGNVYGWCANYSSGRAPSCAVNTCQSSGGTQCQDVLSCSDGYGAIAFPENDAIGGFAAVCGLADLYSAREFALTSCVVAANDLCWTDSSFNRYGSEQSKDSNLNFDLVWYAQSLLQLTGFGKGISDGVMGPATRQALQKFEAALGRDPTDVVDDEILRRLLEADSGIQSFAPALKRDLLDPHLGAMQGRYYSYARAPTPVESFSEDLVKQGDAEQRLALASVLAREGDKCTPPATSATAFPPDGSGGMWMVDCAEGSYTVVLSQGGGTLVITDDKSGNSSPDSTKTSPADDASPASRDDTSPDSDEPAGRDVTSSHPH